MISSIISKSIFGQNEETLNITLQNGNICYLKDYYKKAKRFLGWEEKSFTSWKGDFVCRDISFGDIKGGSKTLIEVDRWKDIPLGHQQEFLKMEAQGKLRNSNKRNKRIKRDPNMPSSLECLTCHTRIKIAASVLMKKAEKNGITWQEVVKKYECQKCNPTKGRKKVDKDPNMPDKLECKTCHAKVKTTSYALIKKAEKNNITWQEVVKEYECQKCNPTKGRKANPAYVGLPHKLQCSKCQTWKSTSPPQFLKQVAKANVSNEELIKSYICKGCKKICTE